MKDSGLVSDSGFQPTVQSVVTDCLNRQDCLIQQGDCIELIKTIPDASVDVVLTDPPYGYLDHKLDLAFDYQALFTECKRVLKPDSFLCFFGRGVEFYKWNVFCAELGFKFKEEVIWDKNIPSSPLLPLLRVHETVAVWQKGKKNLNKVYIDKFEYDQNSDNGHKVHSDLKRIIGELRTLPASEFESWRNGDYMRVASRKHGLTIAKNSLQLQAYRGFKTLQAYIKGKVLTSICRVKREHYTFEHPTQKPIELLEQLIRLLSTEGEVILDPFAGSGSTGVAAVNLNRNFIGYEIDDEYFPIAERRIQEALDAKSEMLFKTVGCNPLSSR